MGLEPDVALSRTPTPTALFHWSPSSRRRGIEREGLTPGNWSPDRVWKAPYVALTWSPSLAWGLCVKTGRGQGHEFWDLWMVLSDRLDGMHVHAFEGQELRVFQRIYKRDVWYVATRDLEEHP